jgi:glycosyltransferase involved in cell wall biosynthesis
MKILFAFENPLPNAEADAEVFSTTARYLAPLATDSWLHTPIAKGTTLGALWRHLGVAIVRAWAPNSPPALRHFFCGLTLPLRSAFRQSDFIYTRNLWVSSMALLFGQQVVFDHYRPWPDQIPPLQYFLFKLFGHHRFIGAICHSSYTRDKYIELGVPPEKLVCVHNGFEPARFAAPIPIAEAKEKLGLDATTKTIVYTGRINHKKGLELVLDAAKQTPHLTYLLVGSYGEGAIEQAAAAIPNVRIIPWQTEDTLPDYIFAADVLLVPPSAQPLAKFGSTVLPLKLFFYLGSGRPILAGDTPDVAEVLTNGETAHLIAPDSLPALVEGLNRLTSDESYATHIANGAATHAQNFTWAARAQKIAATITHWRATPSPTPEPWDGTKFRRWGQQSRRWFAHVLRTRSVILPPGTLDHGG